MDALAQWLQGKIDSCNEILTWDNDDMLRGELQAFTATLKKVRELNNG